MSDKTDREKHLKVLEKMFYNMEKLDSGVILPTSEVKTALAFAISSITTDLKYDLLYEETKHIADADKKIESTTKNDLGVDAVSRKEVEKLVFRFLQKETDENIAFYEHLLDLPSVTPQEPKIKVLDRDEAMRKLGEVDIYEARAWIRLLNNLEYLGMKICEVKE